MKITDSPYAAGTPEHGDWVRNVFIPTVEYDRTAKDRRLRGAASIGAAMLTGAQLRLQSARHAAEHELARLFVALHDDNSPERHLNGSV